MAAFASAIRTNSDSYNFWGMVNSERDVQQRYYTWKALVSLTLLFFFSQRLPFPDGAKSTWHNCSSVSGFSLEVFASNQPSQASSWNWQARNSQGRDWKRDSQSTGSKLTAAEWKTGGGEGRARAFQLQRSGDLGSSWRHLSSTASFRSSRGRDAHTFRWFLPLGLPSRLRGSGSLRLIGCLKRSGRTAETAAKFWGASPALAGTRKPNLVISVTGGK